MDSLDKKVKDSIKVIKMLSLGADGQPIEVSYSGGKDSDVILRLTQMAGVPYRAIYKCTTIDPPGTIAHAREAGAEVCRPEKTFFEIIQSKGLPSRFARFCCSYLKEYKILDNAVQGIRREESFKRTSRYKEPIICRTYRKDEHVNIALPILDWTLADVKDFIEAENIKLAPHYYDNGGGCHYERRLGCIGCPLASRKKRIEELKQYPGFVKAFARAADKWLKTHPNTKSAQRYENGWEMLYNNIFCDSYEQFYSAKHTLFGEVDLEQVIKNYFKL